MDPIRQRRKRYLSRIAQRLRRWRKPEKPVELGSEDDFVLYEGAGTSVVIPLSRGERYSEKPIRCPACRHLVHVIPCRICRALAEARKHRPQDFDD